MNPLSVPAKRDLEGWYQLHQQQQNIGETSKAEVLLIGDPIIKHFSRYKQVWKHHFQHMKNINFGISGDRIQHVLWRVKFGCLPSVKTIIIHVGTNNIPRDQPLNIANALLDLVMLIREKSPAHIILTGILPRGEARCRKKILEVNYHLGTILTDLCDFLKPDEDWLFPNGTLNLSFYYKDMLHLSEEGYWKFTWHIKKYISSFSSTATSFPLPMSSLPLCTTAVPSFQPSCSSSSSLPSLASSFSSTTTSFPLPVSSLPLCTLATVHPSFLPFSATVKVASTAQRCRHRKQSSHSRSTSLQYSSRLKFIDFRNFDKLIGPSKLKT